MLVRQSKWTGEGKITMSYTQLLVLGNGFDLQCGLKSTFEDFEKERLGNLETMKAKLMHGLPAPDIRTVGPDGEPLEGNTPAIWFWDQGLTLWDLILHDDRRTRTWYDIEECIRSWVVDLVKPDGTITDPHGRSTYAYDPLITVKDFWNLYITKAVATYATIMYDWHGTGKDLLRILLSELHRYETAFSQYLEKQILHNGLYNPHAATAIRKLTFDQFKIDLTNPPERVLKQQLWENSTNILDFNYTSPLLQHKECPLVFNVHGKSEQGNIIFGIDGTGIDTGLALYTDIVKFTKTYRLMALSSDPHPSLVQPYIAGADSQETRYIKFFGHSLGQADYSYFQAIFDEVDLYESQTHLIFYYNANRPNDTNMTENHAAEEMFEKVNHLISRYGETLDNKDHGKNLLHKLLLEGRLSVIQAPL